MSKIRAFGGALAIVSILAGFAVGWYNALYGMSTAVTDMWGIMLFAFGLVGVLVFAFAD